MRFVEHDYAVEALACPGNDLIETGCVAPSRSQGWIGHEKNAVAHGNGGAEFPGRQRLDVDREAAKRSPVAPGIFQQGFVLRYPDMAAFTAHPAIENDARNLSAFASARAIAKESR